MAKPDQGTDKIDQLMSEHFMRYMNEDDGVDEYILNPDPPKLYHDEAEIVKTKRQSTQSESTKIESTQDESTEELIDPKTRIGSTLKECFELDPPPFKLFLYLNYVTGDHDCVQASLPVLAAASGLARESCRKALRSLERDGYVEMIKRDQKSGNTYRVIKVL